MLLDIWASEGVQQNLKGNTKSKHIFEQISKAMMSQGYMRSADQCQSRIKRLRAGFKSALDGRKGGKQEMKFFSHLMRAFGNKYLNSTTERGGADDTAIDHAVSSQVRGVCVAASDESLPETWCMSLSRSITAFTQLFTTIKSNMSTDKENPDIYGTNFPNAGHCVIINNINFAESLGLLPRTGTEVDVSAVQKTFESLGYEVIVHTDLTKKQMKNVLLDESDEDHTDNASFVCVIMSHGTDEGVFMTDGLVHVKSLTQYFVGDDCRTLNGKPKLFFLTCSGQSMPGEEDFLIAYGATPGHYVWRSAEKGTYFIQSLCKALMENRNLELMQIMAKVNRDVSKQEIKTQMQLNTKMFPCMVSTLTKQIYFPK
ncbi:hypothetical protein WMY93_010567 [Mugilogobius chulae]|uniref:Uncharacterized protein n=1 Tax=Mugilogobius chulae TaxID=88201 RepID=A0AAW0P7V2_9GOBI